MLAVTGQYPAVQWKNNQNRFIALGSRLLREEQYGGELSVPRRKAASTMQN